MWSEPSEGPSILVAGIPITVPLRSLWSWPRCTEGGELKRTGLILATALSLVGSMIPARGASVWRRYTYGEFEIDEESTVAAA